MNTEPVTSIRIDALDTLFFRDGKPFTMGAEDWADAQFPPSPAVIYGALRSQYFSEKDHAKDLPNANTQQDPTAPFTITLITLHQQERLLFPMPADYARLKERPEEDCEAVLLHHIEAVPLSNCRMPHIISADESKKVESIEGGFLSSSDLLRYCEDTPETLQYERLQDFTVPETKLGIGRQNATHTAEDGKLYRVDMRRLASKRKFGDEQLQHLSLYVEFTGLDLAESGVFRLGGEGKMTYYQRVSPFSFDPPKLTGKHFKLYLATPAFFARGWLPGWIDPTTLKACQSPYSNLQMRLETAIIGKPVRIGGFDMKAGKPKVMRQAVPAGSVYYFTLEGDIQEAVALFHRQRISDAPPDPDAPYHPGDSQQGFGLTFIGGVQ
ncbi:MAG: type III-B CRISPR module-associated protein Cmr3 [Candidatus Vecturithrix sp.]|jgi:CRISPR-associated protein Cmr3|nr:type III-B CRISPR module-associated protein Cmr3 [Candidatus Vecturithrix sp.]